MSLWLSLPSLSVTDIQATLLEALQFPSHSGMFIFLWTVFVTAVILLLLAIGATYRANGNDPRAPSLRERFRKPSFRPVNWRGAEEGEWMLRVGIDDKVVV